MSSLGVFLQWLGVSLETALKRKFLAQDNKQLHGEAKKVATRANGPEPLINIRRPQSYPPAVRLIIIVSALRQAGTSCFTPTCRAQTVYVTIRRRRFDLRVLGMTRMLPNHVPHTTRCLSNRLLRERQQQRIKHFHSLSLEYVLTPRTQTKPHCCLRS